MYVCMYSMHVCYVYMHVCQVYTCLFVVVEVKSQLLAHLSTCQTHFLLDSCGPSYLLLKLHIEPDYTIFLIQIIPLPNHPETEDILLDIHMAPLCNFQLCPKVPIVLLSNIMSLSTLAISPSILHVVSSLFFSVLKYHQVQFHQPCLTAHA